MEGGERKRSRNMEAGARRGSGECRRPESLRMGSKASTWTLMVKATRDEGKSKITEVKVTGQEKKVKK